MPTTQWHHSHHSDIKCTQRNHSPQHHNTSVHNGITVLLMMSQWLQWHHSTSNASQMPPWCHHCPNDITNPPNTSLFHQICHHCSNDIIIPPIPPITSPLPPWYHNCSNDITIPLIHHHCSYDITITPMTSLLPQVHHNCSYDVTTAPMTS